MPASSTAWRVDDCDVPGAMKNHRSKRATPSATSRNRTSGGGFARICPLATTWAQALARMLQT